MSQTSHPSHHIRHEQLHFTLPHEEHGMSSKCAKYAQAYVLVVLVQAFDSLLDIIWLPSSSFSFIEKHPTAPITIPHVHITVSSRGHQDHNLFTPNLTKSQPYVAWWFSPSIIHSCGFVCRNYLVMSADTFFVCLFVYRLHMIMLSAWNSSWVLGLIFLFSMKSAKMVSVSQDWLHLDGFLEYEVTISLCYASITHCCGWG